MAATNIQNPELMTSSTDDVYHKVIAGTLREGDNLCWDSSPSTFQNLHDKIIELLDNPLISSDAKTRTIYLILRQDIGNDFGWEEFMVYFQHGMSPDVFVHSPSVVDDGVSESSSRSKSSIKSDGVSESSSRSKSERTVGLPSVVEDALFATVHLNDPVLVKTLLNYYPHMDFELIPQVLIRDLILPNGYFKTLFPIFKMLLKSGYHDTPMGVVGEVREALRAKEDNETFQSLNELLGEYNLTMSRS